MFQGVYTALITPFTASGEVDHEALRRLVDFQIEGGVDGIVPVGTTGESPTLTTPEHLAVIRTVTEAAAARVSIIAGTGANSTAEAIELTQEAKTIGVDGTLQVTPYYNKPSDAGLRAHFLAVADIGVPVVLYNVPGRTGKELSIDLIAQCAEHESVVSVKEASGSVDRVSQILNANPDLCVLSGDDPLTLPMMCVGAEGVISVASNAMPKEVSVMVKAALDGEFDKARELHYNHYDLLNNLLKLDTNPLPIKTAMALLGHVEENFRLPLCPLDPSKREALVALLREAGLLNA